MNYLPVILLATALVQPSIQDMAQVSAFVEEFSKACNHTVKTPISSGKDSPDTVAFCALSPFRDKYIVINFEVWEGLSYAQRRWTIFHELGHCELDLDHKVTFPPSIMDPEIPENAELFWSSKLVEEFCSQAGVAGGLFKQDLPPLPLTSVER